MYQPFAAVRTLYDARKRLFEGTSHVGLRYDRTGVVRRGDVSVRYYERGPADARLSIVYVHGFNISSEAFYMQVEELALLPVRQVLVDYRGHGHSSRAEPEACTVDAAADDVYAVLVHLGVDGPLIVVGHSLGGPVSLSLMRRHGDLDVVGSVQISSAVDPFAMQGLPQILAGPVGKLLEAGLRAGFGEGLRVAIMHALAPLLALGFYFRPVDYDIVKFHAAMIEKTPLATYAGFFDDLIEHSEAGAADVLAGLPGYILVGERDAVAPVSQSTRLASLWPGAYLQVLPESGHMPPFDAPGAVSTAIVRLASRFVSS
ncbi:alpha/beta fold hydrolase [Corynebacterium liangguodongii]|uniref:Alpha/beta hydrolase n=1 Tax=Corynebacterium liangguodongii TaxID=2079535 RepID=A0A2S0WF93_9CORY|nr:alpha/beta hydrolase [Corynebacterium liangguodongii]AWB84420.1 alpha/beta hydrolase [Corynebacterium liangguodongii]PWB99910.1 alpha/beta hydrolase [Corynebacterium liangguodongii]